MLQVSGLVEIVSADISQGPMLFTELKQVDDIVVTRPDLLVDVLVYILEVFEHFAASDLGVFQTLLEIEQVLVGDRTPISQNLLCLQSQVNVLLLL